MADGKGCKCAAYDQSECACDADWTPQEVYNLRAENEQLKEAIRRLADQDATLSLQGGNVTVTMDATLTDAELKAVLTAAFAYAQNDDDPECAETAARLLAIAERMK